MVDSIATCIILRARSVPCPALLCARGPSAARILCAGRLDSGLAAVRYIIYRRGVRPGCARVVPVVGRAPARHGPCHSRAGLSSVDRRRQRQLMTSGDRGVGGPLGSRPPDNRAS